MALLTRLSRAILGDSQVAIRFLPALAGGGTVLLTSVIARRLGAGGLSVLAAALAVLFAPVYVGVFGYLSMNAYDVFLWTAGVYIVVLILDGGHDRLWMVFGLVVGVGLQNKLSMLFLAFGVLFGLLATRRWKTFNRPWFWLGVGIALLILAPNVVWQVAHDWPTAEFMHNAATRKNVSLGPFKFVVEQVLQMNPLALPLWLGGLCFLFFAAPARRFRALAWFFVSVFVLMLVLGSKPYYLSPAFPVVLAASAAGAHHLASRQRWGWAPPLAVALAASGAALFPLAKPVLPTDTFLAYATFFGQGAKTDEKHEVGRLPQFFADRNGWRELAADVAEVSERLSKNEREGVCILAQNYGQAGALQLFGTAHRLPPVIAPHNNYFLWGPGPCEGEVMIVLGASEEALNKLYSSVELVTTHRCHDCMPHENNKAVWICRGPLRPLHEVWPELRRFI